MADVKDILSLPRLSSSQQALQQIMAGSPNKDLASSGGGAKAKKDSRTREVLALRIDNQQFNTPSTPIVPTVSLFKKKRDLLKDKQLTRWVMKDFKSSARPDGVSFSHWTSSATNQTADYPFAKFNRGVEVTQYTDEEYEKHFKDPNWTREQTDTLFDFCKRYDLRFVVICDRFRALFPAFSIEDIRNRYYSISRKQLELQNTPALEDNFLFQFKYDPEYEKKRKEHLEKLYARSPEQIEEERSLILEMRRIEAEAKRSFSFGTNASSSSSNQSGPKRPRKNADPSGTNQPPAKRRKKNKKDSEGMPINPSVSEEEREVEEVMSPGSDDPSDAPLGGRGGRRDRGSGVYSRSSKMHAPLTTSSKHTERLAHILDDLAIPVKPVPTARVGQEFLDLKHSIVQLIELQQQLKKKQAELKMLSAQRLQSGSL